MKDKLIKIGFLVTGTIIGWFSFYYFNNPNTDIIGPNGGVTITAAEASTLINNYNSTFLQGTQDQTIGSNGGRISFEALDSIIKSAPVGSTNYMNIRFGYQSATLPGDTSMVKILFSFGSLQNATDGYPIFVNSGVNSYCPMHCD